MAKRRELRVVRGKEKYIFTPGSVVESLQGAGIATDKAIALARQLEKFYRQHGGKTIRLEEMTERLSEMLAKQVGEEQAERFRKQIPPFVPIMVEKSSGARPFSRRTLATSLQKIHLSFKAAHAVARQVEQQLRLEGLESVTDRELAHLTALSLEAIVGRTARLRFESQTKQPSDLMVREFDGLQFPYSRGILAQSLMAVGLGPEMSHSLAKRVENVLWRRGEGVVARQTVRETVKSLLWQEAGEEFARRYELMRSIRRPEKPILVLVGGAPGVGKSTLASELGYRLGIPRLVSSDSVRQALRSLISEELSPALHCSSYDAWRAELLPSDREQVKIKRKRVVRGFQRQVKQLSTALMAILSRNVEESTSLVVEGIHLVPGFMPIEQIEGAVIVEVVAKVSDPDRHRNHFSLRDSQTQQRRQRDKYLQHFTEIRFLQDFAIAMAEREGVPVIDIGDLDRAVEQVMEIVLEAVLVDRMESESVTDSIEKKSEKKSKAKKHKSERADDAEDAKASYDISDNDSDDSNDDDDYSGDDSNDDDDYDTYDGNDGSGGDNGSASDDNGSDGGESLSAESQDETKDNTKDEASGNASAHTVST